MKRWVVVSVYRGEEPIEIENEGQIYDTEEEARESADFYNEHKNKHAFNAQEWDFVVAELNINLEK